MLIVFILITFVIAFSGGVYAGRTPALLAKKDKPKAIGSPKQKNSYGHAIYPLEEVKKVISEAPLGYLWDLHVQYTKKGPEFMVLNLIDVDHNMIESKKVDLLWYQPHGTSWETFYSRFSIIGAKTAREQLVIPMKVFSKNMYFKYSNIEPVQDREILT